MNLKVIRNGYVIFEKSSINHEEGRFRNRETVVIFIIKVEPEPLDLKWFEIRVL